MINSIKGLWNDKPLVFILFLAIAFRLISVFFSKGYGMHDDHFLVVEPAKAWVDGYENNNWLPGEGTTEPSGHSFFYAGLHYLLFLFLKFMGITQPQSLMFVVRLLHALLSLIVVYCGYKITLQLAGEKQAKMVGLILAVFWFFPFISVRNLVEVVCIIPMMAATWLAVKNKETDRYWPFVWVGILLGIAFSIRFQTIMFTGGFGLALLFNKQIKAAVIVGLFFLIAAVIIQGGVDMYIWGEPFVEFQEYVRYNLENATTYFNRPWYLYLLFLSGVLIPPVSLFLLFGFFKSWKKHLLLFLPSFIFLLFHSYFPNKQERFILPVIPFIITLGYIGWDEFVKHSTFWLSRPKLLRGIWTFFWCFNCFALPFVSAAYSKKNRVEAMVYLSEKEDLKAIAIEDSNRDGFLMPPLFYLNKWGTVYGITSVAPAAAFYETFNRLPEDDRPNYVVFMQKKNIEQRVYDLKHYFPSLVYETTIEPGAMDKLLHWLNPVNKNQTTYIYKIR